MADRESNGGRPSGSGGHAGGEGGFGSAPLPLTGWRRTFRSLSGNRAFNFLFVGNIGFFFGMQMMFLLRGWLIFDKWGDAAKLGEIMAWVAIPMLLLAPVGGVIADRVDKRNLLLVAQSTLVVTNTVIAALILTDSIEFWHLRVVSVVAATAFAVNMPGRQALVAMLVPRDQLLNAVSLTTAAMNASRIVAPPIAGLLISPIGIGGAYVVATIFYGFAVVATFALPPMPSQREQKFSFFEDFVGGFAYIKRSSLLVGLLVIATVPMIFAMPYITLLPVFAEDVWDVGSVGFGLMQAAGGIGGLVGALTVANLDASSKKGRLLLGGALGFGGFLILFALSPSFYLGLFFLGLVGYGAMVLMTVNNTAIQLIIPNEVRGRVMSVMMMSFGLMPLGAVPAGIAAEAWGDVRPVVVIGGALCVATMLLFFAIIPSLRSLDRRLEEEQAKAGLAAQKDGSSPGPGRPPLAAEPASARAD